MYKNILYIVCILFCITNHCIATKHNWEKWLVIDTDINDNVDKHILDIYIVPACFHCAKFLQSKKFDQFKRKYESKLKIRIHYIVTNASDALLLSIFADKSEIQKEMMLKITGFISSIEKQYNKMNGTQLEKIKHFIFQDTKQPCSDEQLFEYYDIENLVIASAKKAKTISSLYNIKEFDVPFFILDGKKYTKLDDVVKYLEQNIKS